MNQTARPQNIKFKGNPIYMKSFILYCPGANTIRLVWYPIGVIKQADAPKHIAIKNGLGSDPIPNEMEIAIGVRMIATAAFDINGVKVKVTK